jgi:hypothetical protein
MSTHDVTTHAYEEKIGADLHDVKAKLDEFEARAKGKKAEAEIATINHLKTKHHEIETKRKALNTIGDAKIQQYKADLDAELARVKTSLAELAAKLKA